MTGNTPKPRPVSQPESDRFWEGLKVEEIWLQRSVSDGKFQFYPREISVSDPHSELEWVQVSGNAELFTYAIVHVAPHPGFAGDVPYVTALVRLEEDVIVPTNIVGIEPEPENLQIGMRLKPVFEHTADGHTLLKFAPA
ncbi:MAG: OB-fold domain-containing protein [Chloroflexi bacterium]|nr:OB-fold domain-containing protein [Chloroflexota bacterium]